MATETKLPVMTSVDDWRWHNPPSQDMHISHSTECIRPGLVNLVQGDSGPRQSQASLLQSAPSSRTRSSRTSSPNRSSTRCGRSFESGCNPWGLGWWPGLFGLFGPVTTSSTYAKCLSSSANTVDVHALACPPDPHRFIRSVVSDTTSCSVASLWHCSPRNRNAARKTASRVDSNGCSMLRHRGVRGKSDGLNAPPLASSNDGGCPGSASTTPPTFFGLNMAVSSHRVSASLD